MELKRDTIDDLYKVIICQVICDGELVTARGLNFKEVRYQHYILTNPRARFIQNPLRKLQKRFAMGEFIWIMSGQDSLEQITHYNKRMADFSDDGKILHGAYGPRLRNWHGVDQINNLIYKMKQDIYTRQAVMVILDPSKDLVEKTKDVPCNDFLHFMYRGGKLDLMCYVRSNDLFLGFPYDVFDWTMLQEIIACELGVELGEYHHIVGSMHIYDKDVDHMMEISTTSTIHIPMPPMPLGARFSDIGYLAGFERYNRLNDRDEHITFPTDTYWNRLANWLVKKEV
jgi:thymidylate synthase